MNVDFLNKRVLCLIFISLIISVNSFSQVTFQKGEILFDSGEKLECFIKNSDWKNNPEKIEFKLSEDSDSKVGFLNEIQSFEIFDYSKFIRTEVEIDISKSKVSDLSEEKDPIFEKRTVFLKFLIEGDLSLLSFEGDGLIRFFLKNSQEEITQLIYKKYKISYDKFGENELYKTQLFNELKCVDLDLGDFKKLDYNSASLVSIFEKYYSCNNDPFEKFSNSNNAEFSFSIRPGFSNSDFKAKYPGTGTSFSSSEIGYRVGVEAEYFLPFRQKKWSVILEPTFQNFRTSLENDNLKLDVKYNSIEIPAGIRYHFYVNEKFELFTNVFEIFDIPLNSKFEFDPGDNYKIKSLWNPGAGLGVVFNGDFMVEGRYHFKRNLLMDDLYYHSSINTYSFILGYKIF